MENIIKFAKTIHDTSFKENPVYETSRKITELRKNGQLEKAYLLAKELYIENSEDRYAISALGWVLIAFLKSEKTSFAKSTEYKNELSLLKLSPSDNLLSEHRSKVLNPAFDPKTENLLKETHILSKEKEDYQKACEIYKNLYQHNKLSKEQIKSYGWTLWRSANKILRKNNTENISAFKAKEIKSYLNDYLKLKLETPSSPLHSLILKIALHLANLQNPQLDILAFLNIWGIKNFTQDDFLRSNYQEKQYPALIEKTLQIAGKTALEKKDTAFIKKLLPLLETNIPRYPDNKWLVYRKAQLLLCIQNTQEAFACCLNFIRNDPSQYWAWELLGDCSEDKKIKQSCYAKALTCPAPPNFTVKVREKFAKNISEHSAEIASSEINFILTLKNQNNEKIPLSLSSLKKSDWYREEATAPVPQSFYEELSKDALELLYDNCPCFPGCLGKAFSYENKAGKKIIKRKIYVQFEEYPYPLEINHPHKDPVLFNLSEGAALELQTSENDPPNALHFRIKKRNGKKFDIFRDTLAIVTGANQNKNLIYFIADRGKDTPPIEGIYYLQERNEMPKIGEFIKVNLSISKKKNGNLIYQAITIVSTKECPANVYRHFEDIISNISLSGNTFTQNGIFIPRLLAEKNSLTEDDRVRGNCVRNYDKKRNEWGWKALYIEKESTSEEWEMSNDIATLIGYIIKGKIVALSEERALLDIGLEKEGYLTLKEAQYSELLIGDYIEVIIKNFDENEGYAILYQPSET